MRAIQEWLVSWGTPGAVGAAAILALVAPLAADIVTSSSVEPSPEIWDRIASPAGATILGVVVIAILSRMLQQVIEHSQMESAKKDETIRQLIDKMGGK